MIMGFYQVQYYVVGIFLIATYFVYVFCVWLEERNKESTIGKGDAIQDVIHDVAQGKIGRATENMLNYEHDKQLARVEVTPAIETPMLGSDLKTTGSNTLMTKNDDLIDEDEEEKTDSVFLKPPSDNKVVDSPRKNASSIITPFPVPSPLTQDPRLRPRQSQH
jgi:hypothetical protein